VVKATEQPLRNVEKVLGLNDLELAEKAVPQFFGLTGPHHQLRPPPMQVLTVGWWRPHERRVPAAPGEIVQLADIDIAEIDE
jgi:hypothetical protein